MNHEKTLPIAEPMIDARRASEIFRLPYYWFATPKPRAEKNIPHYRIGHLVRFRASELEAWCSRATRRAVQVAADLDSADAVLSETAEARHAGFQ